MHKNTTSELSVSNLRATRVRGRTTYECLFQCKGLDWGLESSWRGVSAKGLQATVPHQWRTPTISKQGSGPRPYTLSLSGNEATGSPGS